MDEKKTTEATASLLIEMKTTAARMRELIVAMPPLDLLGYIYAKHTMNPIAAQSANLQQHETEDQSELINQNQFLLEYVHAVLASDAEPAEMTFDGGQCAELYELGRKLQQQAIFFAMASSADTKNSIFGPNTRDIEFHAKCNWVMLRGNRYPVLEEEFYRYVLAPHNVVLTEVYGANAAVIAKGFQAMANVRRYGHADAANEINDQFEAASTFAAEQGMALEDALGAWVAEHPEQLEAGGWAMDDMFRGGIANVSRHTNLPPIFLADLAYRRGEETEFFASGDFAGTPYRTLPARKKPLIQIGSDYYAVDPCFTRDAGYRALIHSLRQRKPGYEITFNERQKAMSEAAFADILAAQLPGAAIYQEVYYKDPESKKWVENDSLILIDDVLFLVEAKAGAAATIASPALDFGRHARAVQDLVLKAYKQCARFFNYLYSADEVPLFHLIDGKPEVCVQVRRTDYRVMVPIGLTVESFSPFSAYCKELPEVVPLLGKHSFVSLSIDDLFVLKRFLPTPGSFVHYMEVRQAVAGIRGSFLFDEIDHLGAYLQKNRFDQEIADQLKSGKVNMVIWDRMSDVVDRSFEGEDWESRPFPTQVLPNEVLKLLEALDRTRAPGWLSAESNIRNLGEDDRNKLAKLLFDLRRTLNKHLYRYFALSGDGEPLFVWLQHHDQQIDWAKVNDKASAAALAVKASNVLGIVAGLSANGTYYDAQFFEVQIPKDQTEENVHIYEDAERMVHPNRALNLAQSRNGMPNEKTKKQGRNDPCSCGSGKKFKSCHGT
jgi:hypothetical protein